MRIKNQKIISSPGCYPTSILLPLAPVLQKNLISNKNIVIDSKSGYSGAGKNFEKKFTHKNLYKSTFAYGIENHRHIEEIDQELKKIAAAQFQQGASSAAYHSIEKIGDRIGADDFEETLQAEFPKIEGKSIDFAVMERFENVLVVQAPFAWDDLGNWSALPRVHGADENGNTVSGKTLAIETRNCIIHSDESAADHLVVTLGLENCIVVHTPDATLVANRDDESAIKQVVQSLEQREWNQYL